MKDQRSTKRAQRRHRAPVLLVLGFCLAQALPSAWACTACFGQATDSPMARGMNWGIFSLLAVIVFVLGTIGSFFVYLGKRASNPASHPGAAAIEPDAEPASLTTREGGS